MATHKLLLLPGDGIGPEVMGEVQRLIDWLNKQGIASFETEDGLVGGAGAARRGRLGDRQPRQRRFRPGDAEYEPDVRL